MTTPNAFRPHPWHGVRQHDRFPELVTAYIEIVPTDGVKYEIDKISGYLSIDRPQRFSSFCPTLYGFLPKTYCGAHVASVSLPGAPTVDRGDRDPLDICVLTDRPVLRGDILCTARPIGGLRMVESAEADDKIIAVLVGDPVYGALKDVSELPRAVVDRLRHYFLTYKQIPGEPGASITVDPFYDAAMAHTVIAASVRDYEAQFPAADRRA
jgi:inorganic pyrophosphatase